MKNIMQRVCLLSLYYLLYSSVAYAQYDTSFLPRPKMNFHSSLLNSLNEHPQHLVNLSPDAYLQNRNAWKTIKNNVPLSLYYGDFHDENHQHQNDFQTGMMMGSAAGLSPSLISGSTDTYSMNSSSHTIGFVIGFLAGGVAGGLLSNKYYSYGVPSPFNDFIHFNRH